MTVWFTGTMRRWENKERAAEYARSVGLVPVGKVTLKDTQLLVAADEDTGSIKAKKARKFGIRVITEDEFWAATQTL